MALMIGRKIVLPGVFTDTSLPVLSNIDAIEAPGSLILVEPMHPANPWAAGIPVNTTPVTNLFAAKAKTALATALDADVSPILGLGSGYPAKGIIERSVKGGIHTIISPTLGDKATCTAKLSLPTAFATYLLGLPNTNNWFMSSWGRVTKQATVTAGYYNLATEFCATSAPNVNYRLCLGGVGNFPAGGRVPVTATNGGPAIGPTLFNQASAAWVGTKPATAAALTTGIFFAVGGIFNGTDAVVRAMGARIFYRFYLENLTVSGRTYAQADAIDLAEYTKHVLTAGGRYYGDTTPTDPTSLV